MVANYKKNSVITIIIWCSSFLSLIVILAWEFGWVSTDVPQAEISKKELKQVAENNKPSLSEEIIKEEQKENSSKAKPKTAEELSEEQIEKELLALANPGSTVEKKTPPPDKSVKEKPAPVKPKPKKAETTEPVKKEPTPEPTEKIQLVNNTASKVPEKKEAPAKERELLIPDKPKPISQTTNKQKTLQLKPASKVELVSFEKTALIEKPKQDLNISKNDLVLPTKVDANQSGTTLNLDEEAPLAETNLPPEIDEIDSLIEKGKYIAAHRKLSSLYWKRSELREFVIPRIESNAHRIYFSPQPHFMKPYIIKPGDHLSEIAKKYSVPWEFLAKLNQVEPQKIRAHQKLKVIKGPFSALIDLSEYVIAIHAHGYFVCQYSIGVGKDNSTPIGKFAVLNKVANPQYTNPQGVVVDSDDPQNPLGEHWIDLGNSYGIHGTIDPDSIGKDESRGCVRMRNEDVEQVYNLLSIGSEVVIRP